MLFSIQILAKFIFLNRFYVFFYSNNLCDFYSYFQDVFSVKGSSSIFYKFFLAVSGLTSDVFSVFCCKNVKKMIFAIFLLVTFNNLLLNLKSLN